MHLCSHAGISGQVEIIKVYVSCEILLCLFSFSDLCDYHSLWTWHTATPSAAQWEVQNNLRRPLALGWSVGSWEWWRLVLCLLQLCCTPPSKHVSYELFTDLFQNRLAELRVLKNRRIIIKSINGQNHAEVIFEYTANLSGALYPSLGQPLQIAEEARPRRPHIRSKQTFGPLCPLPGHWSPKTPFWG